MSICNHSELLMICDDSDERKEYVCEKCLMIFPSCLADENIAKTPEHEQNCTACNSCKKRSKFRIVKDTWQEQLLEFSKQEFEEPKKKVARS